jgi:hypothetical protein
MRLAEKLDWKGLTVGDGIPCTMQQRAAVMQHDSVGCSVIQSAILPSHFFRIHSPDIHYSRTNSFSEKNSDSNGDVPILVITIKAVWVPTKYFHTSYK